MAAVRVQVDEDRHEEVEARDEHLPYGAFRLLC